MTTKDELGNSIYNVTRILVIEDETHIRKFIMRLLRQIGFRLIDEAEDGAKGLEAPIVYLPDMLTGRKRMKFFTEVAIPAGSVINPWLAITMTMPVVADDDCTSAVKAAATRMPISGFSIFTIRSRKGS